MAASKNDWKRRAVKPPMKSLTPQVQKAPRATWRTRIGERAARYLESERDVFYKINDSLIAADRPLADKLRRGFEQSFGVTVLWIFGDLLGSVELENFPAVHYRNPRRKIAHDRHRVGDK